MRIDAYRKSRAINYALRAQSHKDASITLLQHEYNQNFEYSLEYEPDALRNGKPQEFIARKTKGDQRYELQSRPGESFYAGDIIECYGSVWIVIQVNANKDIYTTGLMERCNHKFQFQNVPGGEIIERWGVLDPGVYSTTIADNMTMPKLDKQFKIYLPLDDETRKIFIDKRFAAGTMYNSSGDEVLVVYRITGRDASTQNYGDDRLLVLNCRSDTYDPSVDNFELGICNYTDPVEPPIPPGIVESEIVPIGETNIRAGGRPRSYRFIIYNSDGEAMVGTDIEWRFDSAVERGIRLVPDGDICSLQADVSVSPGTIVVLEAKEINGDAKAHLLIEVESLL